MTKLNVKADEIDGVVESSSDLTEGKFPVKDAGSRLKASNLSQDVDGKLRATTQIVAEGGIDTVPGTIVSGDGMSMSSSGPQMVIESLVTGTRYQVPYQEIDKTGTGTTFSVDVGVESYEIRQPDDSVSLTSPTTADVTVIGNEVANAIYVKTTGDVNNLRFKISERPGGGPVLRFPDKFRFDAGIGVNLVGAGIHKLDLYYNDNAGPTRFLEGQQTRSEIFWDDSPGTVLGEATGLPWYALDFQSFQFVKVTGACAAGYAASAARGITNGGTFYKIPIDYTLLGSELFTWNSGLLRWEYGGLRSHGCSVFMSFTAEHNATGLARELQFRLYKNGAAVATPGSVTSVEPGQKAIISLMVPMISVTDGDYLELYGTMNTSGKTITVTDVNFLTR